MRPIKDRAKELKAAFRKRAAQLVAKNPNISLKNAARELGVAYSTMRNRRNMDPELVRVMGGRRNTERPDIALATIEEAQRQRKIRAVRDVVIIGHVSWRSIKLRVAKHEGWRKLMASVPFDDDRDWQRTFSLRNTRCHPLYLKLVEELEAQGVPQPQASWQAVDQITNQDRAEQLARRDVVRRRKWGDPMENMNLPCNKPPMYRNEKARKAGAKSKFSLLGTYNLVRGLAWTSGRTVDEEVRSTRPKALRLKYQRAVAEWRDGASSKEYERQKEEHARVKAEREAKADLFRTVRGRKQRATALRNREAATVKRRAEGLPAAREVKVTVLKY